MGLIFLNEMNEWSESTLSKLADDPKLGGMLIEFLDGFAALQRLEK